MPSARSAMDLSIAAIPLGVREQVVFEAGSLRHASTMTGLSIAPDTASIPAAMETAHDEQVFRSPCVTVAQ